MGIGGVSAWQLIIAALVISKHRSKLLNTHSESAFIQVHTQTMSTPTADSGALALRFKQTDTT